MHIYILIKLGGHFLLRLHENLENDVMVSCLVGQVIDTNELRGVYKRSGATREVSLPISQSCFRTSLTGEVFFSLTNFMS